MIRQIEKPQQLQAIILAAGRSSRFNTGTTKLSFTLCGQEMILYPVKLLQEFSIPTTLVVGYQKEVVESIITRHGISVNFTFQEQQTGTGAAVALSKELWHAEHILVMNGDMPLVTHETISSLMQKHLTTNATVTFVTAYHPDPSTASYGRVIERGDHYEIIEAADFKGDPSQPCMINAGIYLFQRTFLERYCDALQPHNSKKELYLTDLIGIAHPNNGYTAQTVTAQFDYVRGVNTLKELWASEHIKRSELISYWMEQGVYFSAAQTTHLDMNITIGAGTRVESGVRILAGTHIGTQCHIDSGSVLERCILADHVQIKPYTVIRDSSIGAHSEVGPFAHIRGNSSIGMHAVIGNFVEVNQTSIGNTTKAKHLSYLGNAQIGSEVNIGAGTITMNYNGMTKVKSTTVIEDHSLIGGNTSIVAPVTIAHHAVTAAGSTITEDIPAYALAIGRARQVLKENYRVSHASFDSAQDERNN